MKIPSRRDNFFRTLLFGSIFICFAPMAFVYQQNGFTLEFLIGLLVIMTVTGLLIWVWHHTYYVIDKRILKFNSGPFKGKIEIENIEKITLNRTSFVGLKFGLARNGIIISSSSHSDLYITPVHPKAFLDSILEINAQITLTS